MPLNEDNSHAKLTSQLIVGELLNGLRHNGLSRICAFSVSIYSDAEPEAKWLFGGWHEVACGVTFQ